MSDMDEKLSAPAPSVGTRARCTLEHLRKRWGLVAEPLTLTVGAPVTFEGMFETEFWRVAETGKGPGGTWLEKCE